MHQAPPRRVYRSPIVDSMRWDRFTHRPGDVVIATPQKCGTTWMQAIVAHLVFPDGLERPVSSVSPWLDARVIPLESVERELESQTHQRFIKTHLPADGLPLRADCRYIVVGRDGRDLAMSLWHHYRGFSDAALASMRERALNEPHDAVVIPEAPDDVNAFWRAWTTRGAFDWQSDGWPFWSDLHVMQSWFDLRLEPNVLLVHYADMLADTQGIVAEVAAFIGVDLDPDHHERVVAAVSFDAMKKDGDNYVPFAGKAWSGGASTFFYKGTNGRWQGVITDENLSAYDAAAARAMTPACRAWVSEGRRALAG
ncbi:MAG: sulfotransferase domain-containing protein [Pseudomonadota bacterium]